MGPLHLFSNTRTADTRNERCLRQQLVTAGGAGEQLAGAQSFVPRVASRWRHGSDYFLERFLNVRPV